MMYLKRGDKVVGPFPIEKIKDGLRNGQLNHNDLASASRTGPWKPLKNIISSTPETRQTPSTSRDDREPSELWILCQDVWKGIATRLKERKDERKATKSDAKHVSRQSDGLFSASLGKLLIATVGVGAVAYFIFGRPSLEQSFKDQVLAPIQARIAKRPMFIRELDQGTFKEGPHKGKRSIVWEKKKYDAGLSYDIIKSYSLVSPHVAELHLDLREYNEETNKNDPFDMGYYRSRESVIQAGWREETIDINIEKMSPYIYVYRYGQWTFVPTEYMKKYCGADHPGPWPIVERKLYEETEPDWKPLAE